MTMTLAEAVAEVRSQLDEATTVFWTDSEIKRWVNAAVRDIARRTETIAIKDTSVAAVPDTKEYNLPVNIARIHKIEFVPTGQNQVYPVQLATRQEMDPIWGLNQNQSGSYPSFAVLWGYTGGAATLKMQVFPVPSQAGTFHIYHYLIPPLLATGGSDDAVVLTVPQGWEQLIVSYVEYRGRRKDRDPTWQEAKAEYEEEVTRMSEMLRHLHDQQQFVTTASGVGVPSWLYDFNYDG